MRSSLAIGARRYLFVGAAWRLPWLRGILPPRQSRKVVAAVQGIVLTVASAGVLWDAGVTREDIASFLLDYPYRRNIGPYVPRDAIERDLLDRQQFAAVFATTFLDTLAANGFYDKIGSPKP